MNIPKQYLPVMPYLILNDAAGFMDFAKKTFDAEEQLIVPGDEGRGIMHGELRIHDAVIMFAGATEQWGTKPAGMFIYVNDVDKVFAAAIANGAKELMPPGQQSYGYTAGFEDSWGNQWWVAAPEQ